MPPLTSPLIDTLVGCLNSPLLRQATTGGAPVLDIDSLYDVSRTGDYLVANQLAYQNTPGTVLATTAGHIVAEWQGLRTVGTNRIFNQATASARQVIVTDPTYGVAVRSVASVTKYLSSGVWSPVVGTNGITLAMRVKFGSDNLISSTLRSFILGDDFSPFNGALGRARGDGTPHSSTQNHWALGEEMATSGGAIVESSAITSDWYTLIGTIDSSLNANLYISSDTPNVTGTLNSFTASRIFIGHVNTCANNADVWKHMVIDSVVSDIAGLRAWLEAA